MTNEQFPGNAGAASATPKPRARWGLRIAGGAAFCVLALTGVYFAARPARSDADFPVCPFSKLPKDKLAQMIQNAYQHAPKAELEALQAALAKDKKGNADYAKARDLAEPILIQNPNALVAHLVLAIVQLDGEANPPVAYFHARTARKLAEAAGLKNSGDADASIWYFFSLEQEEKALEQLDRFDEALVALDRMEQITEPMPRERSWALLKARRFEDCRRVIDEMMKDPQMKRHAYNHLGNLENELCHREESRKAFEESCRLTANDGCELDNLARACLHCMDFVSAEKNWIKSIHAGTSHYMSCAYTSLADLYVGQGRLADTLQILQSAKSFRGGMKPFYQIEDQARFERAIALLCLATGRCDQAVRLVQTAYERPDRTRNWSSSAEEIQLQNSLLFVVLEQSKCAQYDELNGMGAIDPEAKLTRPGYVQQWGLRREILKLLANPELLAKTLNPYRPSDTDGNPVWLLGSLIRILPPGMAAEGLRRAKEMEPFPAAQAYFTALEAEAALVRGDNEGAWKLADEALLNLPATERLLRARTAGVAAQAANRLGKPADERKYLEQVMVDGPMFLRLFDLSLPVKFEDDGSSEALAAVQALRHNPRLREDAEGFVVRAHKGSLELCRGGGAVLVGVSGESDDQGKLLRSFEQKLFSPGFTCTDLDINSLTSRPTGKTKGQNGTQN